MRTYENQRYDNKDILTQVMDVWILAYYVNIAYFEISELKASANFCLWIEFNKKLNWTKIDEDL